MEGSSAPEEADPSSISRIELVSVYINSFRGMGAERKADLEAEFLRRKLPLPKMPPEAPAVAEAGPKPGSMMKGTFLSYVLLIYTGTALFYSWIFLFKRLASRESGPDERHERIQTAIAVVYAAVELLVLRLVLEE